MRKEIGKIRKVYFGEGGYQDAMIGITFELGSDGWGVHDFWGYWSMGPSENARWTDKDQKISLGETTLRISKLLKEAKVTSVDKLKDIPIECTFKDHNLLESWRILKEVL